MKPEPSWLKEWRRKKRLGLTGPIAHIRYGRLDRAIERSLEIERPALSVPDSVELDRLEARFLEIEGAA
jgi:hypothetical protein